MTFRPCTLVLALGVAAACAPAAVEDLPLTRVDDRNPDPRIVEFDLEARPERVEYRAGQSTPAWTYNGSVPGPLIEARVGDRLIVHFRNSLPEPTTVHWHGLRLPAEMDGTPRMQAPVPAGGAFTYDFVVNDAGLFWYHPHMRSNEQVEKGLYGALLVRGADELPGLRERILVLDDALLDDAGQPLPFGGHAEEMLGREGNVVLVNGRRSAALAARSGSWERWRLVSAANARYFKLSLPGHELIQIGTDGGLLPQRQPRDTIQVAPGERVDLLVRIVAAPASEVPLLSLAHTRGHGVTTPEGRILTLRVAADAPVEAPEPAVPVGAITALPVDGPVRTFRLTEEMGGAGGGHGGMGPTVFRINGEAFPGITPVQVELGAVETWEVVNDTEMDHPFHLHGFFFQPLTLAGAALPLQWKDTINVPAEQTLRLAVRFADFSGSFMYHCHILEHAELGMMGELVVEP